MSVYFRLAGVITFLWIVVHVYLVVGVTATGPLYKFEPLGLNEWGDFLAGVFSPLAFLWLIITMLMQQQELGYQR